jgi:hypothetical protein
MGKLLKSSHESSALALREPTEKLDALVGIMKKTKGVVGARMTVAASVERRWPSPTRILQKSQRRSLCRFFRNCIPAQAHRFHPPHRRGCGALQIKRRKVFRLMGSFPSFQGARPGAIRAV